MRKTWASAFPISSLTLTYLAFFKQPDDHTERFWHHEGRLLSQKLSLQNSRRTTYFDRRSNEFITCYKILLPPLMTGMLSITQLEFSLPEIGLVHCSELVRRHL